MNNINELNIIKKLSNCKKRQVATVICPIPGKQYISDIGVVEIAPIIIRGVNTIPTEHMYVCDLCTKDVCLAEHSEVDAINQLVSLYSISPIYNNDMIRAKFEMFVSHTPCLNCIKHIIKCNLIETCYYFGDEASIEIKKLTELTNLKLIRME